MQVPAKDAAQGPGRGREAPPSYLRLAALGAVGNRRSGPPLRPLFEHGILELSAQQPAISLHRAPKVGAERGGGVYSGTHTRADAEEAGPPRPRARHAGTCSPMLGGD